MVWYPEDSGWSGRWKRKTAPPPAKEKYFVDYFV
jgi:hypothetical protein